MSDTDDREEQDVEKLVEILSESVTWYDIVFAKITGEISAWYWKVRIALGWYKHE